MSHERLVYFTLQSQQKTHIVKLLRVSCIVSGRKQLARIVSSVVRAVWRLHSPHSPLKSPWCFVPFLLFCSVHGSRGEEKTKNHGDGAGLNIGVCNSCPAQGDGRCHAGAGGRPATEVDGPRERNANQSDKPVGNNAWTDQQRKPPETSWPGGQDTLEVPFRSLNGASCVTKKVYFREHFPAKLTRAYTNILIFKPFFRQCCSSCP